MLFRFMYYGSFGGHSFISGPSVFGFGILFAAIALWSLFWKGWALWKSARLGNKIWFVVLLLVNTLGILDILYIYFFSENKKVTMKGLEDMMKPAEPVKEEKHEHHAEHHHEQK
ncbi:MAG TPA: DUF5652 family protein [Candidatus Paceibacterota bacterium]|nr:DUF5652 family protein [Candidatus Paceibacterota bacterium]